MTSLPWQVSRAYVMYVEVVCVVFLLEEERYLGSLLLPLEVDRRVSQVGQIQALTGYLADLGEEAEESLSNTLTTLLKARWQPLPLAGPSTVESERADSGLNWPGMN